MTGKRMTSNIAKYDNATLKIKLESLKGLALDDLIEVFSENLMDLVELLEGYKVRNEKICDEINMHLDQNDFASAGSIFHKIKGSAGNIGAMELSKAAASLEDDLKLGHFTNEKYNHFKLVFSETIATIDSLLQP
jgi:HPt (histidine-containing phosphotransfer) domain-containing protein